VASCPICGRSVAPRADNVAFPFCSPRCKQVDLGQWLKEAYRLPVDAAETEEPLPSHSEEEDA